MHIRICIERRVYNIIIVIFALRVNTHMCIAYAHTRSAQCASSSFYFSAANANANANANVNVNEFRTSEKRGADGQLNE